MGDLEVVIKRGSADVLGSTHREAVLTRRVTLAGQTGFAEKELRRALKARLRGLNGDGSSETTRRFP